jgi:hypothetical protein
VTIAEKYAVAFATVVISILLASAFVVGIERGMDHKIVWGPEPELWHITNAISDDVYGVHHGYVGFGKVYRSLETDLGVVGKPKSSDADVIANLSNEMLINGALRRAASFEDLHDVGILFPPTIESFQRLDLKAPWSEDLGETKFYAIAFDLFGLRIQSAYYLFFLLLSISVAAFILQFRRSPVALATLLFSVLAFHVFFYINFFEPLLPTVYTNRFGSTLCIIPALHFMFLLLERRDATRFSLCLAALQLATGRSWRSTSFSHCNCYGRSYLGVVTDP